MTLIVKVIRGLATALFILSFAGAASFFFAGQGISSEMSKYRPVDSNIVRISNVELEPVIQAKRKEAIYYLLDFRVAIIKFDEGNETGRVLISADDVDEEVTGLRSGQSILYSKRPDAFQGDLLLSEKLYKQIAGRPIWSAIRMTWRLKTLSSYFIVIEPFLFFILGLLLLSLAQRRSKKQPL